MSEFSANPLHIDSPASIFLSYSHKDSDAAIYLHTLLNLRGIRVWRDRSHLPAGAETEKYISDAIDDTYDVFVVYMTPESLNSQFVWRKEVAVALAKYERDAKIRLVAICNGVSKQRLEQACVDNLMASNSLTRYNCVFLSDSLIDDAQIFYPLLREAAKGILVSAFDLRLRRVNGRTFSYMPTLNIHTSNTHIKVETTDLDLNWSLEYIDKHKYNLHLQDTWNSLLRLALRDVETTLGGQSSSHKLQIYIKALIPVAFAFGVTFSRNKGFQLSVGDGIQVWSSEEKVIDSNPLEIKSSTTVHGEKDVAVMELTFLKDIGSDVRSYLEGAKLSYQEHIRCALLGEAGYVNSVRDSEHASAIAQQIGYEVRKLGGRGIKLIHLFAMIPAALAVLIGHQLNANAVPETIIYNYMGSQYVPLYTLRPE